MKKELIFMFLILQGAFVVNGQLFNIISCILNPTSCINVLFSQLTQLLNPDMTPNPEQDFTNFIFYAWTYSNGSIRRYELKYGNESQVRNVIGERTTNRVFFHDFEQNGTAEWIKNNTDVIFSTPGASVSSILFISVDYSKLMNNTNQSERNAIAIAERCGVFFNWTYSLFPGRNFSIRHFGFGIGSYIAGMSAEYLTEYSQNVSKVDKLFGLDPYFLTLDLNPRPNITNSQANQVYVIYTSLCSNSPKIDACNETLNVTMGHNNFFLNGGTSQPGCADAKCSKDRVLYIFYSLYFGGAVQNALLGFPCANNTNFQAGLCPNCGTGCAQMSEFLNVRNPGRYFMNTRAKAPWGFGSSQGL